jgi:putative endonuclease
MFSVYILYSISSDKYYVGYTDDIARRMKEHNLSEHLTYTSKHRPWILKASILIGLERSLAMRFERAIKKCKSRVLIEKIIMSVTTAEELAQLVRVPTRRD